MRLIVQSQPRAETPTIESIEVRSVVLHNHGRTSNGPIIPANANGRIRLDIDIREQYCFTATNYCLTGNTPYITVVRAYGGWLYSTSSCPSRPQFSLKAQW